MLTVNRKQLPADEAEVRTALAEYREALKVHSKTVGVPAPWPRFEMLRDLGLEGDFAVVDEEALAITPEQEKAQRNKTIDYERERQLRLGVEFKDKFYPLDDRFRLELLGMLTEYQLGILKPGEKQTVRTVLNEMVELSHGDLVKLSTEVGRARKEINVQAWAKKDA